MGGEKLPVGNVLSKSIYEPDVANYLDVRISRARREIVSFPDSCLMSGFRFLEEGGGDSLSKVV